MGYVSIYVGVGGFEEHSEKALDRAHGFALNEAVNSELVDFVRKDDHEFRGTEFPDESNLDNMFGEIAPVQDSDGVVYEFRAHTKPGDGLHEV